jgi:hypothetical protein
LVRCKPIIDGTEWLVCFRSELKIGLLSELVLALIFGSLAGVMSSIMIVMGTGQQVGVD